MHEEFKKIGKVAKTLSDATGKPESVIASQIRIWMKSGSLEPDQLVPRGNGEISDALFGELGLCRIRLLIALTEAISIKTIERSQIEGDEVNSIAKALAFSDGGSKGPTIKKAIEDAKSGSTTDWLFELKVIRDTISGATGTSAIWIVDGKRAVNDVSPSEYKDDFGLVLEAAIQIPFTNLVKPLLSMAD